MLNTTTKPLKLIPVPQWNDYHPWPPIGGRVLVDEAEFFACVERQNEEAA